MIRHIVLLRFRPDVSEEVRARLMHDLSALRGRMPGIRRFTPYRNASTEERVMHGFLDGFVIDFDDVAARDAYVPHPLHRAVGERLVAACEGGPDGIVVFDHVL